MAGLLWFDYFMAYHLLHPDCTIQDASQYAWDQVRDQEIAANDPVFADAAEAAREEG